MVAYARSYFNRFKYTNTKLIYSPMDNSAFVKLVLRAIALRGIQRVYSFRTRFILQYALFTLVIW